MDKSTRGREDISSASFACFCKAIRLSERTAFFIRTSSPDMVWSAPRGEAAECWRLLFDECLLAVNNVNVVLGSAREPAALKVEAVVGGRLTVCGFVNAYNGTAAATCEA